jgi:glutamate N-acetyltransferase/amino-acid N-acetyltransferase
MEDVVKLATGYRFAGIHCGLKADGALDLALMVSDLPATAAAVFTRNRFPAAPVLYGRRQIASGVPVSAVLVNAGNANACTGSQGEADLQTTVEVLASVLELPREQIFVSSTGVIGEPLPVTTILQGLESLEAELQQAAAADLPGLEAVSRAIMTTDRVPKVAAAEIEIGNRKVLVTGLAKGAGMIEPDMATMLAYLLTDVEIERKTWQEILGRVVDVSFNRITVDGDTSTNDTVLGLANGASGVRLETAAELERFEAALRDVARRLSYMIVKDGEGATKVVTIRVVGAPDTAAAERIARVVANSALVKTAFFGRDANWGRIIAAVGYAGVAIDPEMVNLDFDAVRVVTGGRRDPAYREEQGAAVLQKPEFVVKIDLGLGEAEAEILTADLTHDYVSINADYRS